MVLVVLYLPIGLLVNYSSKNLTKVFQLAYQKLEQIKFESIILAPAYKPHIYHTAWKDSHSLA